MGKLAQHRRIWDPNRAAQHVSARVKTPAVSKERRYRTGCRVDIARYSDHARQYHSMEVDTPSFPKSEEVIATRSGDVLIKQTLLKADHFPNCQNLKLRPLLDGAPNFRQVEGLPVYGVAIPTVRGLRNVLDELGAANGQRRVLWHNMREEPVLYINGKPYVVREADQPFCNVEYTGIDRSRVEDMESRLKADVLREAARYDQHILVTEEDDDMNVIDVWEPVTESDVQTPLEVYKELQEDGYDVDYTRVPITDEKAPKDSDFELLIRRLWDVPLNAALMFNCQMGRGRTTTGMVIATLVVLKRLGAFPTGSQAASAVPPHIRNQQRLLQQQQQQQQQHGGAEPMSGVEHQHPQQQELSVRAQGSDAAALNGRWDAAAAAAAGDVVSIPVPEWFTLGLKAKRTSSSSGLLTPTNAAGSVDAKLKAGLYGVVRSLLRVLEKGVVGKAIVDTVLDACSAMQNLREAIATYRGRLMAETKESRRATLMAVCIEYLERYAMLIAFSAYLSWSGHFDPCSPNHVTFQTWMESRPELRSVFSRMLRRNPLAALELHIPAATLPPTLLDSAHRDREFEEEEEHNQAEERADVIIESRGGAVLGALTILKEDYFPGMKSSRLPQLLPGAGNFRRMAGPPVYGVAMCTVHGIRNVLRAVADAQLRDKPKDVLWFNMREEPVVYINGLPFVLREQRRPLKNLQEYAGIDAERLERMEARLKADVLAEAEQCDGKILVARESAAAPGKSGTRSAFSTDDTPIDNPTGELVDMWETIKGPDAVQTPAEVYAALAQEGLAVRYLRVPVTDGKAPQPCDIDNIIRQVRSAGYDSPMVFNCQMGAGRTTTGTVIGGLLAMHGYGTPPAPLGASGGVSGGGGLPSTAALGAAGAFGSALPPPIAVGTGPRQQQQGSGPSAAAAAAAAAGVGALRVEGPEGLVAELNEGQTRDILREEIAGDSPRCSDDERDDQVILPRGALSSSMMTTPLTPRGAPLNHANSSSTVPLAALTPTAGSATPAGPSPLGVSAAPAGDEAAAGQQQAAMQPPAALSTPQGSFARSAAVAAVAAAGGVGWSTPGGVGGGEGSRAMVSTPSFTSLRELWGQLSPEEVQERISLAGGGYVGVRRVVRLLEHGDQAKRIVDAAIDANAAMLNLRVCIMRFRKPKHSYQHHKSEVASRHSAFTRGSAYLERYCLLIAFGAYLEEVTAGMPGGLAAWQGDTLPSFADWLDARPELYQALGSIHLNPVLALAPIPVSSLPVLYRSLRGSDQVTPAEQEEVLRKRRGRTLNRRIILKSYLARAADPSLPPGTPEVRQALGLPVFAVGNVPVAALARLLETLGAGESGDTHVVVTDVREELVVYINGMPYIRRELEMPAAAMHHAGVHARQLETLEMALKEDVVNEAAKWGGKVLLHQEVAVPAAAGHSTGGATLGQQQAGATAADRLASARSGSISSLPAPLTAGSFLTPPAGPLAPAAVKLAGVLASPAAATFTAAGAAACQQQLPQQSPLAPAGPAAAGDDAAAAAMRASSSQILVGAAAAAEAAGSIAHNAAGDVITAPVDVRPGSAVVPFWEPVDLDALELRRSSSSGGNGSGAANGTAAGQPPGSSNNNAAGTGAAPVAAAAASSGKLSLGTCLEVAKALQAKGLHLTYRRIPLSRERTPVPGDLSDMLKQMLALPAGVGPLDKSAPGGGASDNAAAMMQEAATAAAGWGGSSSDPVAATQQQAPQQQQQQHKHRSIVHLVVSRTATGSSARFASAAFATFLAQHSASESRAAASGTPNSPVMVPSNQRRRAAAAAAAAPGTAPPSDLAGSNLANGSSTPNHGGNSSDGGSSGGSPKSPDAKRMRRTMSDLGEYRVIMSLVRLLPGGMEVKNAVDGAIDHCSAIGNLRSDIAECKHTAEAAPQASSNDPGSTAWAARQLGVHYLKRYFLLIAFRCYLVQRQRAEQLGRSAPGFTKWVEDRRELSHLLNHANLNT